MNYLAFLVLPLEVRDVEGSHGAQRQGDRFVRSFPAPSALPLHFPQGAKNARPIESLAFAVFTVVRHEISDS
jgi:hypothetical protein